MTTATKKSVTAIVDEALSRRPAEWISTPQYYLDEAVTWWVHGVTHAWQFETDGDPEFTNDEPPVRRLLTMSEQLGSELRRDATAYIRDRLVAMAATFDAEYPEAPRADE